MGGAGGGDSPRDLGSRLPELPRLFLLQEQSKATSVILWVCTEAKRESLAVLGVFLY